MEKILELSVKMQSKDDLKSRDVIVDSTVQEKNITYPTDAKLARKIIDKSSWKNTEKHWIYLKKFLIRSEVTKIKFTASMSQKFPA